MKFQALEGLKFQNKQTQSRQLELKSVPWDVSVAWNCAGISFVSESESESELLKNSSEGFECLGSVFPSCLQLSAEVDGIFGISETSPLDLNETFSNNWWRSDESSWAVK